MKSTNALISLYFILGFTVSVSYCFQDFNQYPLSHQSSDIILSRVKRKGGRGGGGRSRGSSGRKSSSKSRPKPADPYPKQPPYNPSYNPAASAPNSYPKQPGQSNPGQTGYGQQNYPGQTGHYPGQTNYGQTGYGTNYGKTGGLGGIGSGLGTGGFGKSKSGIGALGAGVAGGALGAAAGAYGGYKLGKMVGGLGTMGHYGYYNDRYQYVRCDPPPKIEVDPETNITYIPKTITYDARCEYYDRQPPRVHPYYNSNQRGGYYMNGDNSLSGPTILTTLLTLISVSLFGFDAVLQLIGFRVNCWTKLT